MYLGTVLQSTLFATAISVIYATGKNINPRFRFKIKASYAVTTEGDVRRVTVLAVEANTKRNMLIYSILYEVYRPFKETCFFLLHVKLVILVSDVYFTTYIHVFYLDIGGGGVFP